MIVVPTPELDCPAARALRMEGVAVVERYLPGPLSYGRLFTDLWEGGEPFVIVEWDIIPWPGAVQALLDCPKPWCTYRYPLHRGKLAKSFGIGKYCPSGSAPSNWTSTEWRLLDGAVLPVVQFRLGRQHVHEPPVAHARREPA